jgi:hypothetical protein
MPMGLLVSALLALAQAEPTWPLRAAHYEQLGEGWMRSRLIRLGMSHGQVDAIMGPYLGIPTIMNLQSRSDFYYELGVTVDYDVKYLTFDRWTKKVTAVDWRPTPFYP